MTSVFTAVQHFCNLHCMFAHFVLSHLIQTLNTLLYTGKISLWVSFLKSFTKLKCLLLASDEFFSSLYFLPVRNRIWEQILGTQSRGAIKLKRVYPIKHTSPQIQTWLTGKYVSKQEGITSTFVLSFWWELTLSWLTGRIEMPFLSRRASFVQIQHVLLLGRAGLCNFEERLLAHIIAYIKPNTKMCRNYSKKPDGNSKIYFIEKASS